MPGAPNRPPETPSTAPPPPSAPDGLERKVLRRLSPSRIALRLDVWKGAPSRELVDPLARADALYTSGDFRNADIALDQLSVRFAEPRWPTLPNPYRSLRVNIPAPQPPAWDPEYALPPQEKEAKRARREAESQLALARASVDWARSHAIDAADLEASIPSAEGALANSETERFWSEVDRVWSTLLARVPMPTVAAARPPPAPPAPAAEPGASAGES